MLFDPAHLSYWIFLGIGVLLLILAIASGGGDDNLDLDLDAEGDVDLDSDGEFGFLGILGWLGFGQAPILLLLAVDFCLWGLIGWVGNILVAGVTGSIPVNWFGWGGIVLLISFCLSLLIGSFIARPLGKIFAAFGEDTSSDRLIGCLGIVASKKVPYEGEKMIAQADIIDPARNLVTVAVCLPTWAEEIPLNGQEILVIEHQENYYLVISNQGLDKEKWLHTSQ